jgi:hypothetical protein
MTDSVLPEEGSDLSVTDYFPSDGDDDDAYNSDNDDYLTDEDENESYEPATLIKNLEDFSVPTQTDNNVSTELNFPSLPSNFHAIQPQSKLGHLLSQNVPLIRQLESRTSQGVTFCLDEIDRAGLLKDFSVQTSKAMVDILLAKKPPTLESFLALPNALELDANVQNTHFVVYLCVWRKTGTTEFRTYTGSALSLVRGAAARIGGYRTFMSAPTSANLKTLSTNSKKS